MPADDDRFQGPNVQSGDLVSVEINGVMHTECYQPGNYQPAPQRTRWQRIVRALTPKWWRKPLPVGNDPLARAQAMNEKTLKLIEKLTR